MKGILKFLILFLFTVDDSYPFLLKKPLPPTHVSKAFPTGGGRSCLLVEARGQSQLSFLKHCPLLFFGHKVSLWLGTHQVS